MPDDKVLSQADIDAMVSKLPSKKAESRDTKTITPASKEAAPSPVTPVVAAQTVQPAEVKPVEPSVKPMEAAPTLAKEEYDTIPARLSRLESNYVTVKKEVQALLLDLREKLLEHENPFQQAPFIFKPTQEKKPETGRQMK